MLSSSSNENTKVSLVANEAFSDKRYAKIAKPWTTGSYYMWLTFREAIIRDFENSLIMDYISGKNDARIEGIKIFRDHINNTSVKKTLIHALQTIREELFSTYESQLHATWNRDMLLPYYVEGLLPIPITVANQAAQENVSLPRRYGQIVPHVNAVELTYHEICDIFKRIA